MKVAILTMQRVDNMGSLLQAYALKKIIESKYNVVEFIDICSDSKEKDLLRNNINHFNEEGESNDVFGKIFRIDRYFFNRIRNKFMLKRQFLLYEEFRTKYLDINKTSEKYDICVIGSDEVFNCQDNATWGFTSQLFGNVANAERIITYAASCGATEIEHVPDNVKGIIRKAFDNVDYISVRDRNTYNFVEELTGNRQIYYNLDPVFLYDFNSEINEIENVTKKRRYCVVYSYYNRIHESEYIRKILDFCNRYCLIPIAAGAPQFWIKEYCPCSPFQCLKLFSNADFIITDTFHGTIFSSKFTNKFAIITRRSNNNKLVDLIQRLGIKDHVVSKTNTLEVIYNLNDNKSELKRIRDFEMRKTLDYIKMSIGNGSHER